MRLSTARRTRQGRTRSPFRLDAVISAAELRPPAARARLAGRVEQLARRVPRWAQPGAGGRDGGVTDAGGRSSKAGELRPLLFSIAYRMLASVAEAEDVVQEAYLRY